MSLVNWLREDLLQYIMLKWLVEVLRHLRLVNAFILIVHHCDVIIIIFRFRTLPVTGRLL